jgi:hypothetical protein
MKKLALILFLLLVAWMVYIDYQDKTPAGIQAAELKRKKEQAAINAVKKSYSPSLQLIRLNPDFQESYWTAIDVTDSVLCDSSYKECWRVAYDVQTMPGADKKTITAEWFIDLQTMRHQPANTEARIMFVEHQQAE